MDYGDVQYNYGFKITPEKSATYYVDFNDTLLINSRRDDVYWDITRLDRTSSFMLEAEKEYYFVLVTNEPLNDENAALTIASSAADVTKVECINPPSEKFIREFSVYISF